MRRDGINYLQKWLRAADRKPLIIRGARQVGKTWIVRQLVKISQYQLIELNFEKQPELAGLFVSNDPKRILLNLEAVFNISIDPANSLLFLDEIQAAPELLAKLRWFAEDLAALPVIAAGSLLEFVLSDHKFSMPVGRITYFHLEPLSFEEFLQANNQNNLVEFIRHFQWGFEVPSIIHQRLINFFKEYLIVGGLPAVVAQWIETRTLDKVQQIQHDLLATYRDDFSKYSGRISIKRFNELMQAIPKMLTHKFIYSHVSKEVQIASIKNALELLVKARICHRVSATAANGVPLGAESKSKNFKMIFLDVGLVSASLGLNLYQLQSTDDLMLIHQGQLSEQVVGQLLRTIFPFFIEPTLYYWLRDKSGAEAEIDYVIQHGDTIIPIEVKSGSTGTLRSLHLFMAQKELQYAIRVNSNIPSQTRVETITALGEKAEYTLISMPFYLIGQLNRLK